jgi:ATP-dependent Clp protease ATP-binding subunit ClpA
LQYAKHKAAELQHAEVDPEHLFFGFLKEGSGVGINVLKNLRVNLNVLNDSVVSRLSEKPKVQIPASTIPFSDPSKQLLKRLQHDVAAPLGHSYVDTAHLLLGLLEDQACGEILRQNGVSAKAFTEELIELLGPGLESNGPLDRISITLALPEFVDPPSVEDCLVELFISLDNMNRALGGPGLDLDEGELFLGAAVGVGVPQ